MNKLKTRIRRFFLAKRDSGISNLMLYLAVGNLVVWVFSILDADNLLYYMLRFDRAAVLRGQVWRLFTYVFTYLLDVTGWSLLVSIISLLCFFFIGRALEQYWGTLRFNCYYFMGLLLMDLCAMVIGCNATTYYLNLSLFLAIATITPDSRFLLFYIIPVKAKYLAWVDIAITLFDVIRNLLACIGGHLPLPYYGYAMMPIIVLLNYILFLGSEMRNILPDFLKYKTTKTQYSYKSFQARQQNSPQQSTSSPGYRHKCTVCGRTDVSDPNLEFRYCSKCSGFHCYCIDHINSHVHITD